MHTNFSTKAMREDGGYKKIIEAVRERARGRGGVHRGCVLSLWRVGE
jgi:hypothetical protein